MQAFKYLEYALPRPTYAALHTFIQMARISLLFFSLLAAANAYNGSQRCSSHNYDKVKGKIRAFVLSSENAQTWPSKFLFLVFHDCFTYSCDGSVAFETSRPENSKVQKTIDLALQANSPVLETT